MAALRRRPSVVRRVNAKPLGLLVMQQNPLCWTTTTLSCVPMVYAPIPLPTVRLCGDAPWMLLIVVWMVRAVPLRMNLAHPCLYVVLMLQYCVPTNRAPKLPSNARLWCPVPASHATMVPVPPVTVRAPHRPTRNCARLLVLCTARTVLVWNTPPCAKCGPSPRETLVVCALMDVWWTRGKSAKSGPTTRALKRCASMVCVSRRWMIVLRCPHALWVPLPATTVAV